MIPYARLRPGRGFLPGQSLLYYLQRLVTRPWLRRNVSRLIATMVNLTHGGRPPRPRSLASQRALATLRDDGIVRLRPLADATQMRAMHDYFVAQPVIGPGQQKVAVSELPAGVAAAAYDLQTIVDCPGLLQLVNAPEVLEIAAAYIGCKPTLSSLGVRWSLPAPITAPFQAFHRDIDDWRFLKLFVYLTDVDERSGPHCYVRTSHLCGFVPRAQQYPAESVAAEFGADKLEIITGARGATFIADTSGVHRGGAVERAPRLVLQAQYSILPVFAFRYAPVPAACAALDAYVNRLLIAPTGRPLAI